MNTELKGFEPLSEKDAEQVTGGLLFATATLGGFALKTAATMAGGYLARRAYHQWNANRECPGDYSNYFGSSLLGPACRAR